MSFTIDKYSKASPTPQTTNTTNLDITPSSRKVSFTNSTFLQNIMPAPQNREGTNTVHTPSRKFSNSLNPLLSEYYSN